MEKPVITTVQAELVGKLFDQLQQTGEVEGHISSHLITLWVRYMIRRCEQGGIGSLPSGWPANSPISGK